MKYYIAYGSNLSVEQMAVRCPDATVVGPAVLKNWKLAFCTYATIERRTGSSVPVVVWQISAADEAALDRYEGYPNFYKKRIVPVVVDGRELDAMVYVMCHQPRIAKHQRPWKFYEDVVRDGYRHFGLDESVIDRALSEC